MPADGSADAPHQWPVLRVAADIEETAGNLDGAFALHERLRRAMVLHVDAASPSLAVVDYNLGKLDLRRDRAASARAALLRARDGWTRGSGRDHLDLALVHTALQQWETQYGSLATAREHAERALVLRTGSLPPNHPDIGLAHLGLGAAAMQQGDLEGARAAYLSALSIHEHALGVDHPQTALVRINLGEARIEAGDGAAALRDIDSAVAVLEQAGPLDPGLMAFVHRVRAGALRAAGADTAALVALDRAESLGADVTDPPEAALRALERVRLARRQPAAAAWDQALDTARVRAARVAGDGAMIITTRLDALASDPPSHDSAPTVP
jgi:tetratricopeptide (TPR) repeat protein